MTTADSTHRDFFFFFLSLLISPCDPLSAASCSQWTTQPLYSLIVRERENKRLLFRHRSPFALALRTTVSVNQQPQCSSRKSWGPAAYQCLFLHVNTKGWGHWGWENCFQMSLLLSSLPCKARFVLPHFFNMQRSCSAEEVFSPKLRFQIWNSHLNN